MRAFASRETFLPLLRATLGNGRVRVTPLTQGLLNQNMLVEAGSSRFVFKVYRPEMPREKVDEMHRLMTHVSRRGIPVPLPIATYAVGDHAAALYSFIDGTHPERYGDKDTLIRTMGQTLGQVDVALDSFRPKMPRPSSLAIASWDPEKAAQELVEIRASLRGKPRAVREDVEYVVAAYEAILPKGNWDKRRFAKLPVRVCHNDYHIKNMLVRGGKIVAVLDWEKAGWDWRGYEVFRSVMFNCRGSSRGLEWRLIVPYVRGYKRFVKLNALERELAFDCGFNKAFFSLWAVKQYVAGNRQTRDNMLRRARGLPHLFKHQEEFRERIARELETHGN